MQILRDQVRSLLGIELEELAGAAVSAEIPLTNAVVNRVIAARLAEGEVPISAAQVEALDGNALSVRVVPSVRVIPTVRIDAQIEQQPQLPDHPVFRLRWTIPGLGPLARLAARFLTNLSSLPRGIHIEPETVTVNLREMLVERGLGDVLQYVRSLRIETRSGVFVVKFELGL
jgi:hypothetical protein